MSIRVITEPSVYLIGRPTTSPTGLERFLSDHGVHGWPSTSSRAAEVIPEVGGRLCYMSFANPRPGGNAAYLKHILEVGHGSVIEHTNFTLIFTGVSRSLTHELVRHRAGMAYSQLSQRYVDESDVAFVMPPLLIGLPDSHPAVHSWRMGARDASIHYQRIIANVEDLPAIAGCPDKTDRRKRARETARSVLPNCTETRIMVTGNCRAFRNFLEQRGSEFADAEIRRLALAVLPVLVSEAAAIFGDYSVAIGPSGVPHITTPFKKV